MENYNISNHELDRYLEDSEGQYTDIRPGNEKQILWVNRQNPQKTTYSIVYLHGYSASRQEISPVCEMLAQQWQCNLFFTRLIGHGRTSQAMEEITLDKLLADAQEALEIGARIGEKIILVGTSTGASLASCLAQRNRAKIHALVFLSPNFGLKRKTAKLLTLPFGKLFLKLLQGDTYEVKPINQIQENYWTSKYPSIALIPLMQLLKQFNRLSLEDIHIPLLCFYSEKDQVVSSTAIKKCFGRFGSSSKKLVEIESQEKLHGHVLAGDILSPGTTRQVVQQIDEFLKLLN